MAENYVLLETIELNQSAASVIFDNIPQSGYTDFKIIVSARINAAVEQGFLICQPNSATTNLSSTILYGFGNNQGSASYSVEQSIWSYINGSSSTSNTFSNNEIYISNYNSSSAYKSVSVDGVNENNATNARQSLTAGLWSSNTAISSVKLYPTDGSFTASSFLQYSTFSLYGIAATGTTPAIAPKASGGNMVASDGTYWYHAFLSSGTFTPFISLSCDYLVVAGGGAGASVGGSAETGGGGGAGGFRLLTSQSLPAASYTATVGAGGSVGSSGTNSTINSISATGGGYGGGGSGGSGGGGLSQNGAQRFGGAGNAGSYSPVEGYAGGNGNSSNNSYAGGGGGAGAVGANGTGGQSGAGGVGAGGAGYTNYAIINAMASATNTGVLSSSNYYFAGGGGGGSASGVSAGSGGTGGGGAGETAGTINTGGGAGGGSPSSGSSRSGGSGIIIIRYAMA